MEFEKIKLALWGAAGGAFALFGIGFGMGGWVLGGTAVDRAEIAVIERLTPICLAQAARDPQKNHKIKTFQSLPYNERGRFVEAQGWATMPGEQAPDGAVAENCSNRIAG